MFKKSHHIITIFSAILLCTEQAFAAQKCEDIAGHSPDKQAVITSAPSHPPSVMLEEQKQLDKLVSRWKKTPSLPLPKLPPGYVVRVVFGFEEAKDFHMLTPYESHGARPVVFAASADALPLYHVHRNDPRRMLEVIGYPNVEIDNLLNGQMELRLIIFKDPEPLGLATWQNVFARLAEYYNGDSVWSHSEDLALALNPAVQQALVEHYARPEFDNNPVAAYEAALKDERLGPVRLLLLEAMGLNRNFTGTGRTYSQETSQSVAETLTLNRSREDYGGLYRYIDLNVRRKGRSLEWYNAYLQVKPYLAFLTKGQDQQKVLSKLRKMKVQDLNALYERLKRCQR